MYIAPNEKLLFVPLRKVFHMRPSPALFASLLSCLCPIVNCKMANSELVMLNPELLSLIQNCLFLMLNCLCTIVNV